jgi:CheY-like chemotaxis protein
MSRSNSPKAVLIDDTHATRYAVSRILTLAGFEVKEAATGKAGLQLISEGTDLIFLDIQLPDISGLEVCEKIRQNPETASIPIIHLSATFITNEDQALGLEGGADAYLIQPVAPALFEPYWRTAAAESSGQLGWGLGLTLVRGFSESHGGSVNVISSIEQGTTFTITLPKSSEPAMREA